MGGGASTQNLALADSVVNNNDKKEAGQENGNSMSLSEIFLGDIVELTIGQQRPEGVVVEIIGDEQVVVHHGDTLSLFNTKDCRVIKRGTELEMGDRVSVRQPGEYLGFIGFIQAIHPNGTYDVIMDNEDPEDAIEVERGVELSNIVKIESSRLRKTFRRSSWAIVAAHTFATSTHTHNSTATAAY